MHRPHLALSTRPDPEVLARRWFSYFIITIATAIVGIVLLLSSTDGPPPGSPSQIGESNPRAPDTR
jgi:hypothetical protein